MKHYTRGLFLKNPLKTEIRKLALTTVSGFAVVAFVGLSYLVFLLGMLNIVEGALALGASFMVVVILSMFIAVRLAIYAWRYSGMGTWFLVFGTGSFLWGGFCLVFGGPYGIGSKESTVWGVVWLVVALFSVTIGVFLARVKWNANAEKKNLSPDQQRKVTTG